MPIDPSSSHTSQDVSYEINYLHNGTGVPVSIRFDMFSNSEAEGDQTLQELVDLLSGADVVTGDQLSAWKRVNTRNLATPTPPPE
jgi:hypothetical protein